MTHETQIFLTLGEILKSKDTKSLRGSLTTLYNVFLDPRGI